MRRLGLQQDVQPVKVSSPPTPSAETAPAPILIPAFFHRSPIALYDLTAPIPAAGSQSPWTVFSKYDCESLEIGYQEMVAKQISQATELADGQDDKPSTQKCSNRPQVVEEDGKLPSNRRDLLLVGIERLHSVSFEDWKMKPVYWSSRNASATYTSVRRGTWFYAADFLPVDEILAASLEQGYQEVKPWTLAYEAELTSAGGLGEQGETKLKYDISSDAHGRYVIYRNERTAWIGSRTIGSKLVKSLYSTIGRHRRETFIEVYRGYDFTKAHPVSKATTKEHVIVPSESSSEKEKEASRGVSEELKDMHGHKAQPESEDGIPKPTDVTDLILVVHGIGQKLAETSEGWTFTHAVNKLRLLIHEQLIHKEVKPTLRDGFCPQVLPINWRVNFDPDAPPPSGTKQKEGAEMFSLDDITIDAIPAVRDLIGKVVFDIPYYMSHHKPRMIEAVVKEANRIYALWLENNPTFESSAGRMHIICHSLGSAISFDVLSNQPNDVKATPSFYDSLSRKFSSSEAAKIRDGPPHFDFNTGNLFCAGSPAAFFLLLKQHHLIPRKALKPDNSASKDDKLTTAQGVYGCLAAKEIYNIFYATDPIAYRMNATIDSGFAQNLPPTQILSTTSPFFSSLRLPFGGSKDTSSNQSERPELRALPSQVELETHDFTRETLADQRLQLLNSNGTLDYVLPMSGYIDNQYLSMVYAHQGYWDSREFARFIVVECGKRPGEIVHRGIKKNTAVENLKKLPPR